jgi:phosphopantetheine--protein transferase-like protein
MSEDKIVAFLSRLTASTIAPDQRIVLRSAQRAAFESWLGKEGIQHSAGNLMSFAVSELCGRVPVEDVSAPQWLHVNNPIENLAFGEIAGVGIDTEDLASMPEADDYREHEFYRDHFTTEEVVYCIQQADPKASFCGLWAAKEAVIKAGGAAQKGMRAINISHDSSGRPTFSECLLSISRTTNSAIAICIRLSKSKTAVALPSLPPPSLAPIVEQPIATVVRRRWMPWALAVLLLIIILGGIAFVWRAL